MTKNSKRAAMLAGCAMLLAMSTGNAWAQKGPPSAADAPETPADAGEAFLGEWVVDATTSPLDGRRTYAATLRSSNAVHNSLGYDDEAWLAVRCQQETLAIYVVWPFFIGTSGATVSYRFGSGNLRLDNWSGSSDGTAVGRFDSQTARPILTELAGSDQFVIRVSSRRSGPQDAVFDTTGADAVVAGALAACA